MYLPAKPLLRATPCHPQGIPLKVMPHNLTQLSLNINRLLLWHTLCKLLLCTHQAMLCQEFTLYLCTMLPLFTTMFTTLPLSTTSLQFITEVLATLLDTFSEVDITSQAVTTAVASSVVMVAVITDVKLNSSIEFIKA